MSTHNICFRGEITKNDMWIPLLSGAMTGTHMLHQDLCCFVYNMTLNSRHAE